MGKVKSRFLNETEVRPGVEPGKRQSKQIPAAVEAPDPLCTGSGCPDDCQKGQRLMEPHWSPASISYAGSHNQGTISKPKVVVTGFGPFPGVPVNPSAELVRHIHMMNGGESILLRRFLLPVRSNAAGRMVREIIESEAPEFLIMFGVDATQKTHVRVEKRAINTWRPGYRHPAGRIRPSGPAEYASRLPVASLVRALNSAGIPAVASNSAGTFVCNYAFYSAAAHIRSRGYETVFGFVHLPLLTVRPASFRAGHRHGTILNFVRGFRLILEQLAQRIQPGTGKENKC